MIGKCIVGRVLHSKSKLGGSTALTPAKVKKGFQVCCDLGLDLIPKGFEAGKETTLSVKRFWRTLKDFSKPLACSAVKMWP